MCGLKKQGERNFSPKQVNNNSPVHQRIKTESYLRKECSSDGQPLLSACCHSFVEVDSEGMSARKDLRASDARWKTQRLSQCCWCVTGHFLQQKMQATFLSSYLQICSLQLSVERYEIFRAVTRKSVVSMCLCVCERERETKRERQTRERTIER